MTIRPVDARDLPLILGYLKEMPHPANESVESLEAQVLRDGITMIEDAPPRRGARPPVFRLVPDFLPMHVTVPWMLPRAREGEDNLLDFPPVMLACFQELVRRHPETLMWPCSGVIEGKTTKAVGETDKTFRLRWDAESKEILDFIAPRILPSLVVEKNPDGAGFRGRMLVSQFILDLQGVVGVGEMFG